MITAIDWISEDRSRKLRFVIETPEDFALARQRITALRQGAQDASVSSEIEALEHAVRSWLGNPTRQPSYPH